METGMPPIPRYNVLGVGISALNLTTAREAVLTALTEQRKGYVCTVDARVVNLAAEDPELRARLNASLLTTPDGMPLVWLGRWQGHSKVDRVYGPDLMLTLCEATAVTGHTHFFYGGVVGVAESLRNGLTRRFPGLRVVGTKAPPFRPLTAGEEADLVSQVTAVKPNLFWVGLSVPNRERFMAEFLPKLETTLMIGVGAAFDLLSGRIPQAPRWMQRSGLEWLFRLCVEPRRLAPRYFRHGPLFILRVAAQLSGLKKYDSSADETDAV
jgi:N-acetylglucosaminyldiphosphoundecaprenol N-acetyl-beta-D-mannosaminyltransferase